MKAFFEEYGFVALAAIVVIILIVMATPIGKAVETNLQKIVTDFMTTVGNQLNTVNSYTHQ